MTKIYCVIFLLLSAQSYSQTAFDSFLLEKGLPLNNNVSYEITDQYFSNGWENIYLAQKINGVPVYGSSVHLIRVKGTLMMLKSRYIQSPEKFVFSKGALKAEQAFSNAFLELSIDPATIVQKIEGKAGLYSKFDSRIFEEPAFGGEVWLETEEGIQHCWFVSFEASGHSDWNNYLIDAVSGEVLRHFTYTLSCEFNHGAYSRMSEGNDEPTSPYLIDEQAKTASSGSYRVLPLPVESPYHGNWSLVSNPHDLVASPFGWHDTNGVAGNEFTITRGNSTYAYEDRGNQNAAGYAPDGGNLLNFDFPHDLLNGQDSILDASITNLFYVNNKLHDLFYHYGFDEASGNFQQNNYNRGGQDGDYVRAEAQDGSGTNNANFSSPVDGSRPRMQMYLWSTPSAIANPNILTINSPSVLQGSYFAAKSTLGPVIANVPITAQAVLVDDGTINGSRGCNTIINTSAINGKIALVDRGDCTFVTKILNAQAAGAIAVIVINNVAGTPISMGGSGGTSITIPSVMINLALGNSIKSQLQQGPVNITLYDSLGNLVFDSSLDNGVIAHEFTHGVSIRLTGGPSVSTCLSNQEQGGEGWSDFFALAFTSRSTDQGITPRGIASYLSDASSSGNGIRVVRYSTSMAVNYLTYNNIKSLSVPHGIGTMWASCLWDLFWALTDKYGYDEDWINGNGGNNIALQLVMDGLKLQPCNPGFVDSRDAILLADSLFFNGDHKCLIWDVFARRGLGYLASQGLNTSVQDGITNFDVPASCLVGIPEYQRGYELLVYPNPANQYVEVVLPGKGAQIEWYNILGEMLQPDGTAQSEEVVRFAVENLPSGMYVIRVHHQGKSYQQMIFLNH